MDDANDGKDDDDDDHDDDDDDDDEKAVHLCKQSVRGGHCFFVHSTVSVSS